MSKFILGKIRGLKTWASGDNPGRALSVQNVQSLTKMSGTVNWTNFGQVGVTSNFGHIYICYFFSLLRISGMKSNILVIPKTLLIENIFSITDTNSNHESRKLKLCPKLSIAKTCFMSAGWCEC